MAVASTRKRELCKDCHSHTRKLDKPGPRCATCWRSEVRKRKARAYAQAIEKRYGITIEQYDALYIAQGGVCYICRRATGKTRRLAVDHNHKTGKVRGLLCKLCNRFIIGYARDNAEMLKRAIEYLTNPPADAVLETS